MIDMMIRRFGPCLALVTAIAVMCAAPAVSAQQAEPAPKPGRLVAGSSTTAWIRPSAPTVALP